MTATLIIAINIKLLDTASDIDLYLASDVPMECYRKDIDYKLLKMREDINLILLADLADSDKQK